MLTDLRYSIRTLWKRPSGRPALLILASVLFTGAAYPAAQGGRLSLKDVMRRVAGYVDAYGEKASIVVGTERYRQEAHTAAKEPREQREIVSDVAIVKVEALRTWLGFRDVIEVDGVRVSDRDDRLASVLMASEGRFDEARRLSDESARFNIGSIQRNFNLPTATLFFFNSENSGRFKLSARTVEPDGTWPIEFHETERPTMIRTPEGRSIYSEGTIWVSPSDGVIVRTRLKVEIPVRGGDRGRSGAGVVDVTFHHVAALDMWLPETMTETFENGSAGAWHRVEGRATYDNYRRFETTVRIK
jgi:hypothetical protein